MRVILDTDKKTITLPWNYREKLEAYNKMVIDISGDESKKKNFKSFVDDVWKECMANSDNCLKTADKPKKDGGQVIWARQELRRRKSSKYSGYIGN